MCLSEFVKAVNLLIYAIAWETSIFAIKYSVYFSFRQLAQNAQNHEYLYFHMHETNKKGEKYGACYMGNTQ